MNKNKSKQGVTTELLQIPDNRGKGEKGDVSDQATGQTQNVLYYGGLSIKIKTWWAIV